MSGEIKALSSDASYSSRAFRAVNDNKVLTACVIVALAIIGTTIALGVRGDLNAYLNMREFRSFAIATTVVTSIIVLGATLFCFKKGGTPQDANKKVVVDDADNSVAAVAQPVNPVVVVQQGGQSTQVEVPKDRDRKELFKDLWHELELWVAPPKFTPPTLSDDEKADCLRLKQEVLALSPRNYRRAPKLDDFIRQPVNMARLDKCMLLVKSELIRLGDRHPGDKDLCEFMEDPQNRLFLGQFQRNRDRRDTNVPPSISPRIEADWGRYYLCIKRKCSTWLEAVEALGKVRGNKRECEQTIAKFRYTYGDPLSYRRLEVASAEICHGIVTYTAPLSDIPEEDPLRKRLGWVKPQRSPIKKEDVNSYYLNQSTRNSKASSDPIRPHELRQDMPPIIRLLVTRGDESTKNHPGEVKFSQLVRAIKQYKAAHGEKPFFRDPSREKYYDYLVKKYDDYREARKDNNVARLEEYKRVYGCPKPENMDPAL